MIEVIQFIFSSFWIWAGFTITIVALAGALRGDGFVTKIYQTIKKEIK